MKNLIYALSLFLLIACRQSKEKETVVVAATEQITLNGLTFADADTRVKDFLKTRTSSEATTSIWLSEAIIDGIIADATLDGMRIYFAKENQKNTIVVVATKLGKPSDRHQKDTHTDYFGTVINPIGNDPLFSNENSVTTGANLYTMKCSPINVCQQNSRHSVSCQDAINWAKSFKSSILSNPDEIINTTSIWYERDLIKKLKAKLTAARNSKKADGIRIYFVKNDSGKHGFVIVPTYKDSTEKFHIDDFTCYEDALQAFLDIDDRGEECPIFCGGTTWNDCENP